MIVSKEFYELFDFNDCQVKYLSIEIYSLLSPVNKFEDDEWTFNEDLEDKELIEEISLSAYVLFKFLLYTNLIYSVKVIEIYGESLTEIIVDKLCNEINKWRNLHHTALFPI